MTIIVMTFWIITTTRHDKRSWFDPLQRTLAMDPATVHRYWTIVVDVSSHDGGDGNGCGDGIAKVAGRGGVYTAYTTTATTNAAATTTDTTTPGQVNCRRTNYYHYYYYYYYDPRLTKYEYWSNNIFPQRQGWPTSGPQIRFLRTLMAA